MRLSAESFNMPSVIQALFVAWQDPATRRFFPIGRLAQIESDKCDECYEFVYVVFAQEAVKAGFLPLLSFPKIEQVYRSRELFPIFANRLLPTSRPDFGEYIHQLGLPPATSSPIIILSRSSGRRATDTLELFPLPKFELGNGYQTWFWAHGIRYLPQAEAKISELKVGEQLFPLCDFQNPAAPNAILLRTRDFVNVGFMPTYLVGDAHELQQSCEVCEVYVDRINLPPIPLQQRLLCRLAACWPDGFVPYSSEMYLPIPMNASEIPPLSLQTS